MAGLFNIIDEAHKDSNILESDLDSKNMLDIQGFLDRELEQREIEPIKGNSTIIKQKETTFDFG